MLRCLRRSRDAAEMCWHVAAPGLCNDTFFAVVYRVGRDEKQKDKTMKMSVPAVRLMMVWVVAAVGAGLLAGQGLPARHVDDFKGKPRMIVISDIGNEPDDQMSLVRLLLYSNELDIEGLIATTSTWQKTATHPETMRKLVEAYGQVRPNLSLNAKRWPEAAELMSRVYQGQTAYGLAATGEGKSTEESRAIVRALEQGMEREDTRPLWICLWGVPILWRRRSSICALATRRKRQRSWWRNCG